MIPAKKIYFNASFALLIEKNPVPVTVPDVMKI